MQEWKDKETGQKRRKLVARVFAWKFCAPAKARTEAHHHDDELTEDEVPF